MTQLYIPNTHALCKLRFVETGRAAEFVVTLGLAYQGIPDLTMWEAAGHAINTVYGTAFATGTMHNSLKMVGNDMVIGNGALPPREKIVTTLETPYTGTMSAAPLPLNCCVIARKNTAFIGKKQRGRMYFPGTMMNEDHIDELGNLSTAEQTTWNTNLGSLYSNLVVNSLQPCLFHPVTNTSEQNPTDLVSLAVAPKIGTQRRRIR